MVRGKSNAQKGSKPAKAHAAPVAAKSATKLAGTGRASTVVKRSESRVASDVLSSSDSSTPAQRGPRAFVRRWATVLLRVSMMPMVLVGVGVYRAWIASFFRFGAYPGITFSDYALFEVSIGVASFVCAALARRIAPLWANKSALIFAIVSTTLGSALIAVCALALGPGGALQSPAVLVGVLKAVGLVSAGAGTGVVILLWCEFYAALNPMRVAVYHAVSIFSGEVIIWLLMGLRPEWVVVFSLVLPAIAVGCGHRAELRLLESERPGGMPRRTSSLRARTSRGGENVVRSGGLWGLGSLTGRAGKPGAAGSERLSGAAPERQAGATDASAIPWKPIALMATCTFAMQYGTFPVQPVSASNVAGVIFATAFVFFGSLSNSRWFNFDTIYRVAFPAITAACMLAAPLARNAALATWCYEAGYTMLSMYIMIVLSNLTYRFGINAVWLNGIERGIRYVVETLGWATYMAVTSAGLDARTSFAAQMCITVAIIVVFLVIVSSEKELSARWGVTLRTPGDQEIDVLPTAAAGRLSMRVSELSATHGLSDREEEVLQLMARRVPMRQMEESLFVAQGTIKAHTGRIYRKLGIHSREELYRLLGVADAE